MVSCREVLLVEKEKCRDTDRRSLNMLSVKKEAKLLASEMIEV